MASIPVISDYLDQTVRYLLTVGLTEGNLQHKSTAILHLDCRNEAKSLYRSVAMLLGCEQVFAAPLLHFTFSHLHLDCKQACAVPGVVCAGIHCSWEPCRSLVLVTQGRRKGRQVAGRVVGPGGGEVGRMKGG